MKRRENPFPATAVTTFGVRSVTPANLKYMRQAFKVLVKYLKTYRTTGLTVGLSGAHGGGKTFLLSWLADQAKEFTTATAYVIYGKADSPSFVDLYQQLMQRITRDDLIKVIRDALRVRAEEITGKAKATNTTAMEIKRTGELDSAYASKVIDPNELNLWLRHELEKRSSSPDVGRRVAAALGLVDDSTWGEPAFDWLSGHSPPLPNEVLQTPLFEPGSAKADETVVAVLDVLAALFRLAGTPLVILVDQLENLVSGDEVMHTSSILKKLMEHLSLQCAMLVLAGTPRAWKRLPRDVRPRIAEQLIVGNLSITETRDLLKAYLRVARLSSKPTAIVFRVAGGNPREILQTAFQIHEETRGSFARANEETIRKAAAKAGTLVDREQAALEILDQVAAEETMQVLRPSWREAGPLDRLVTAPGGGALAVVFAVSSDRSAEAELGLRLTRLKRELASDPASTGMLVVAIGYSSDQVRDLLSDISRVMFFTEVDFADELRREFAKLTQRSGPAPPEGVMKTDEALLQRLDTLESLLSRLQQTRAASDEETAQRFSALTEASAAPERRQTEIRTRTELRQGLDELSEALAHDDVQGERAVLRRLLVANEANVSNESFDLLGTIYLDALDAAQLAYPRYGHAMSNAEEIEARRTIDQLRRFRADLTRMLRQALSPKTDRAIDRGELRAGLAMVFGLLGAFPSNVIANLLLENVSFRSATDFRIWIWLSTFVGFVLFAIVGYAVVEYFRRPQYRYLRMSRYLDRLRARQERER